MADTVDTLTIRNANGHLVQRYTNESDGTGESGVTKVDISTFQTASRATPTYSTVRRIEWVVAGMNYVVLRWDHDTDDEIAVLPAGSGVIDFTQEGGGVDPRSTGGTGDIKLTTDGAVDGASYNIVVHYKLKA